MQRFKQVRDRSIHQYVMVADDDGDYYFADDVDREHAEQIAEIARLKAESDMLKAALRWLCEEHNRRLFSFERLDIPPQFAALIAEATKP
jgi:hypothetical protein